MADNFKTAPLFIVDLPAMSAGRENVRFHYADMADMPMFARKPESAWDDLPWDDDNGFRGGTMANAIKLARYGWQDGAEQAQALHAGVQATVPSRKRLARYDVAGAFPSIPRALAGNPLYMRRLTRKETSQRPIVSLVCNICVSALFPVDEMLKHAAAVASIVDFLETAGFRCEVLVVSRFDGRVNAEVAVQLKAPEQPLNLATVAYGIGHPSFLRRLMFAVVKADSDCSPLGGGLGMTGYVPPAPELGTFTIAAANSAGNRTSAPARFRHILRELADQGCPGIPEDALAA